MEETLATERADADVEIALEPGFLPLERGCGY
jgi:hypothetical protein